MKKAEIKLPRRLSGVQNRIIKERPPLRDVKKPLGRPDVQFDIEKSPKPKAGPQISGGRQGILDLAFGNPGVKRVGTVPPDIAGGQFENIVVTTVNLIAARQAIEAKARQLGGLPGAPLSDVQDFGDGYVGRFQGCDIYYSSRTGAHEIHGDIRAKFNALLGASENLGLPVTDEMGTSDGVGRFNNFEGGSIFWSPSTGPMMVRGPVRDSWSAAGLERSPLGYPVMDAHRKRTANPLSDPPEEWSIFQNGGIYSQGNRAAPADIARLTPEQLAQFVGQFLGTAFREADNDLGIEGGVGITQVTDWQYGFWTSQPRRITFAVSGFHKVPVLPDTTFRLEMTLQFDLRTEYSFVEPLDKTLVAELKQLHIHTSGVGHGSLFVGLRAGIWGKFQQPLPIATIPAAAHLMDILVIPTGELQFLLEPDVNTPTIGRLRALFFQQKIDELVG